jgi:hypothetical protein
VSRILVYTPTFTQTIQTCVNRNHKHCMAVWTRWSQHEIVWAGMGRVYLPLARSWACEYALKENYEYVFWLDDDAVIGPDYLQVMLDQNLEWVAAPYPMRPATELIIDCGDLSVHPKREVRTGIRTLRPDPTGKEIHETLRLDELNQGVVEIAGSGFHCALMKTSVLTHSPNGEPTLQDEFKGDCNDGVSIPYVYFPYQGGEDLCFCERLRRKGYRLWCHTDLWADHVVATAILARPGVGAKAFAAEAPGP